MNLIPTNYIYIKWLLIHFNTLVNAFTLKYLDKLFYFVYKFFLITFNRISLHAISKKYLHWWELSREKWIDKYFGIYTCWWDKFDLFSVFTPIALRYLIFSMIRFLFDTNARSMQDREPINNPMKAILKWAKAGSV